MRFKRGTKVEVFCKDEVPSGSWHCAEVICGNGHYYTISGVKDAAVFERVSNKFIRPCPPVVQISGSWMPGDVVEVFHDYAWKMATISKVLRENHFLVRLVGSSNEFKVYKFDIRLRQSWMDGKWVLVGKGFGNSNDQKGCERPSSNYNCRSGSFKGIKAKLDSHEEKDYVGTGNNINIQESPVVPMKTPKRVSRKFYPQAKAPESTQKFRATERNGRRHRVAVANPSTLPKKIESCAFLKELPGEKEKSSRLDIRTTKLSEMDERGIRMDNASSRNLECADADDVASSVGSCSIVWDNPFEWPSRILACPVDYAEDHSSDAESVCQLYNEEDNYLQTNEEELNDEIHRLELHAYCCTLQALHASGPLSWEQETLMTNLRISLHISNDEHLMVLRNLISNATSMPIG